MTASVHNHHLSTRYQNDTDTDSDKFIVGIQLHIIVPSDIKNLLPILSPLAPFMFIQASNKSDDLTFGSETVISTALLAVHAPDGANVLPRLTTFKPAKSLFNGDIQNVKKHYYVSIKYLTKRKETSYGKRNEHPGTFTPRLCTS